MPLSRLWTMHESHALGELSLWGSEVPLRREVGVKRAATFTLASLIHYTVAPPIDCQSTFGNLKGEEYDDGCDGNTTRECSGENIIVLGPELCITWSEGSAATVSI